MIALLLLLLLPITLANPVPELSSSPVPTTHPTPGGISASLSHGKGAVVRSKAYVNLKSERRSLVERDDEGLSRSWLLWAGARVDSKYNEGNGGLAAAYALAVADRRRANNGDIQLTNHNLDTSYSASLTVGTPVQSLNVVLDTGSSDLWVASDKCHTASCSTMSRYDSSSSSSSVDLTTAFSIQYGSGTASGTLLQDIVTLGGYSVASQTFASCDDVSSGLLSSGVSGIMGLSWKALAYSKATPWWITLAKSSSWSEPLFAFYLARYRNVAGASSEEKKGGLATFGYLDSSLYSGDITYVSIADDAQYWQIPIDSAVIQGSSIPLGSSNMAAIDTGTTLIGGPEAIVAAIYAKIHGARRMTGPYSSYYEYPCNTNIQFDLAFGGYTIGITDQDFNLGRYSSDQTMCTGAVYIQTLSSLSPIQWIVGDAALKNTYTIFRYQPAAVGFAALADELIKSEATQSTTIIDAASLLTAISSTALGVTTTSVTTTGTSNTTRNETATSQTPHVVSVGATTTSNIGAVGKNSVAGSSSSASSDALPALSISKWFAIVGGCMLAIGEPAVEKPTRVATRPTTTGHHNLYIEYNDMMEGTPLTRYPPNDAVGKRKSMLNGFFRRSNLPADTILVPRHSLALDTMEKQPQRSLSDKDLSGVVVDEEQDADTNLPAVRLIPPVEDEGEPVSLFPLSPPLRLDTRVAPESPTADKTRRVANARVPGRRPQSVYSSTAWNGMAEGFVLPPPKFSRSGAGFNPSGRQFVVMPKTKREIVQDRQRRMSNVEGWDIDHNVFEGERPVMIRDDTFVTLSLSTGPSESTSVLEGQTKPARIMEEEEEQVAIDAVTAEEFIKANPISNEGTKQMSGPPISSNASLPTTPVTPSSTFTHTTIASPAPESSLPLEKPPISSPTMSKPSTPNHDPISKPGRDRRRTLSLSAAFSGPFFGSNNNSKDSSAVIPPLPPLPPLPKEQTHKMPKKQKSLRNLFASSIASLPAELSGINKKNKDKEGVRGLLKSKSKPNLRIDTSATNSPIVCGPLNSAPAIPGKMDAPTPITPGLLTGLSDTFTSIPDTPTTASTIAPTPSSPTRPPPASGQEKSRSRSKLNKKFSLSNMSVFKRRSSSTPASAATTPSQSPSASTWDLSTEQVGVPQVPDLPKIYRQERKEKEARKVKNEYAPVITETVLSNETPVAVSSPVNVNSASISTSVASSSADFVPFTSMNQSRHPAVPIQIKGIDSIETSPVSSTFTIEPSTSSAASSEYAGDDDPLAAQFMQLPSPVAGDSQFEASNQGPVKGLENLLAHVSGKKSEVVVVEGRKSLEALVILGSTPDALLEQGRITNTAMPSSIRPSQSHDSFASCDSSSTLGKSLPLPSTRVYNDHGLRRESAESEGSEDTDEGVVTPVQDSVEAFVRHRKSSEDSGTLDFQQKPLATLPSGQVYKSARRHESSLPPNSPLPPTPQTSTPFKSNALEREGKDTLARNKMASNIATMDVKDQEAGSLHFDLLGLNLGFERCKGENGA
ncbi:uncharacterized protein L203_104667 [Cryptococcus depauperatus CBS 7841]|uniref:Peptidase A1 domain-containing protein n=1 Tax=Cryptococcus depauperatus CBS 7841 TaxID=1295531 RepID=A0AAJ8JW08_9TREE